MDDRYYHAFLPPSIRIAGRRLNRFTIWHQFLLSAMQSPIATGAERFTIPDLIVAAKCCTAINGERVTMRPQIKDMLWSWIYHRFPWKFERDAKALFQWLGHQQQSKPLLWREKSGKTETVKIDRAPQCLGLACSLMHRAGFSRFDAWNTPVVEARWIDAQVAKLEGVPIHFLDDDDLNDTPISFEGMTDEEVLEQFKRDLPNEDMAIRSFEHWKQMKDQGNA